ncbi:MAG: hypothetical protein NC299_17655 [Lachnospiraceae bacterium]|nr:hypothetical protein [Lachnospiraceae bacterium]
MFKREDKREICEKLGDLLRSTDYWQNVEYIDYRAKAEQAIVFFKDRDAKCVNVAMDSGMALITDILKAIS